MEILPTFELDRGEPYTRTVTVSTSSGPVNFTGWSATAKVYDTNRNLDTGRVTPLIETIPSLDSSGNVVISFTGEQTKFITPPETEKQFLKRLTKPTYQYVCEIRLVNPSGVLGRLMKARVKVTG